MNHSEINRIWYGGEPPPLWMRGLVPLYRFVRFLSRLPQRLAWVRPTRLPLPVVVVGNVTVGGAGKTPLVVALIEDLRARGRRPGVLSRGYAGKATSPVLLDESSDPVIVGDEPCMIRQRTGVPVAIGRDRIKAARLLLGECVDIVIIDDGLQNSVLHRDIEICVVDGERRFGNGLLLPAGPLRESVARLSSVDFVICNGGVAQPGEIPMTLAVGEVRRVGAAEKRELSSFAGQTVHAVAGIGNPDRFFASLRQVGVEIIEHAFDDHHRFLHSDLAFADDLPVLMTEKDAVKCSDFIDLPLWYVPVDALLPATFLDALDSRIARSARV